MADITNGNKVLREIKGLTPKLKYCTPPYLEQHPSYLCLSDASHGFTSYGPTGYLSGIPACMGAVLYHRLDWLSVKQSCVAFSSIGPELLAPATSTDRGALMAESLQQVYGSPCPLPFVLNVDSHWLYSTVKALHDGTDNHLRPTVASMRESFEEGEIATMQWIPGKLNLADALTKRNLEMYGKLNQVMVNGKLDLSTFQKANIIRFKKHLLIFIDHVLPCTGPFLGKRISSVYCLHFAFGALQSKQFSMRRDASSNPRIFTKRRSSGMPRSSNPSPTQALRVPESMFNACFSAGSKTNF